MILDKLLVNAPSFNGLCQEEEEKAKQCGNVL